MSELKVKDKANSTNTDEKKLFNDSVVPITTECLFEEVDLVFTTELILNDLSDLAFLNLCSNDFPIIEKKLCDYFSAIDVIFTNPSVKVRVEHTCCITNDADFSCKFITHAFLNCESYYDVYLIENKLRSGFVSIFKNLEEYFSSLGLVANPDTDITNSCYLNTVYRCSEYRSNLRNSPQHKD